MTQKSERKRWITWELTEILTYIDNNIDSFYESGYATCAKAKEATQTTRSVGSVYYKVSTMLKAMDNYNKTGEKTCQDIWTNEKIYEIVKSICGKYRERMRKEREQEMEEAARKRRKKNVRFETDTRTNTNCFFEDINQKTTGAFPRASVNISQIPFSIETIDSFYKCKMEELDKGYTEARNLTEEISQLDSKLKRKREMLMKKLSNIN